MGECSGTPGSQHEFDSWHCSKDDNFRTQNLLYKFARSANSPLKGTTKDIWERNLKPMTWVETPGEKGL